MLRSLSWLYGKIIDSRNVLYESGNIRSVRLPAPTISVGNITVGGTGKTPLVALIAEYLADKGETVCIISRGYKRRDEKKRVLVSDRIQILADIRDAGDEPFELARKLIGKAFVIADRDRVAGGHWASREFGITAFVLDDAFQHRKVERDLDIVAIDATNPFGNNLTLPSGILREPLDNLKRADLAILTRSNLCPDSAAVVKTIHSFAPELQVLLCQNKTKGFLLLKNFFENSSLPGPSPEGPVLAFCGLGNPYNFFEQLKQSGLNLVGTKSFPDHYDYRPADLTSLLSEAAEAGAEAIITTAKDALKLDHSESPIPIHVCVSEPEFDDKKSLTDQLDKAFN